MTYIISILLVFFSLLPTFPEGIFSEQAYILAVLLICLLLMILLTVQVYLLSKTCKLSISIIDLFIITYLSGGYINAIFHSPLSINHILFLKWVSWSAVYIVIRLMNRKEMVLYALGFAGGVQALIAIGQQWGYIHSFHPLFPVTGSFGNPGQLGGFQAVTFTTSILLMSGDKLHKKQKFLWGCMTALIGYSLLLADSRAAWVAIIIGFIFFKGKNILSIIRKKQTIVRFTGIILFAILCIAIFYYRESSANARLLVWRVTADMIFEQPITGHGIGSFNDQYMLYQANYFTTHPESHFTTVADNAAYPYNELLHLLAEQGIVGLILILPVFGFAFKSKDRRIKVLLSTLLAFSMFSYPCYIFPLLLLFAIILGLAESEIFFTFKGKIAFVMILSCITILFIYRHKQKCLYAKLDFKQAQFINEHIKNTRHNLAVNNLYTSWLKEYPSKIEPRNYSYIFPTCESHCYIGNYYLEKGEYQLADQYYQTASYMIPTRILPKYCLWKSAIRQKNIPQAIYWAKEIIHKRLKIENTTTLRIKGEVLHFLNEQKVTINNK